MSSSDTADRQEPRIPPLAPDDLTEDQRALAVKLRTSFGLSPDELPESVATMMRHPEHYAAHVEYVTQRAKVSVLATRDLEILILRTAWLCSCAFVWGEHVRFGKNAGLTDDEIEWLVEGSSAHGWNERDRGLVRTVEELHDTSHISDETWKVIAAYFDEAQIIEILTIVGAYHEFAYLYNGLRVRLIPGNPGLSAR